MKSRIISLSEKGLNLDTFNNASKYISSKLYAYRNNILMYTLDDGSVIQYDLKQDKEIYRYKIDKPKQIKLCQCGLHDCALTFDKKLYYLHNGKAILFENNVDSADIICFYIAYVKNAELTVKNTAKLTCSDSARDDTFVYKNIKDFILSGDLIFFSTNKTVDSKQKLVCYDPVTQNMKNFEFENIIKFSIKNNINNEYFLISITTEYSKASYFGCMKLYFYNKKTLKEVVIQQPLLFYDFVDNGFIICYGQQPSKVTVVNYLLEHKKKFPEGIRNAAYINNHGNLVGFTGFGNLSGDVEIHSTKLLCKIKVLGASVFNWSPCGSYFMIGTTNELKVDNKIAIYDYYGRSIQELHFDNLESCVWVGEKEPFTKLSEPQNLNVIEEVAYVPPHLRKEKHKKNKSKKEKTIIKENVKSEVQEEESLEDLQRKITEIIALKTKIKEGETLSVDEYNKILNESEIMLKIQKITKKILKIK